MSTLEHLEEFQNGFIAGMCFADSPEDSMGGWDSDNLSEECQAFITSICTIYLIKCAHLISNVPDLTNNDLCHWGSVGADLYCTIVGHGVGLWETDKYPEDGTFSVSSYLCHIASSLPYFEPQFDSEVIFLKYIRL